MNLVSFHGLIAGVSIAMTLLVIWAAWGEHREAPVEREEELPVRVGDD